MHDLIIIGGGAASLAAAVYALGKKIDFLMIYEEMGGKSVVRQRLPGQPDLELDYEEHFIGQEAVHLFERYVRLTTGKILHDRVVDITMEGTVFTAHTLQHGPRQSTAVIVATGATPVMLDIPGAKELVGRGLGYSITTYAPALEGKTVAVVGATVRALRGVGELAQSAAKIYLVAPDRAGLATPLGQAVSHRPNVEVFAEFEAREIVGDDGVEELVIGHAGRQQDVRLKVDAVFADLGLRPNSGMVKRLVQTDANGFIMIDSRNASSVPGLFAAGDVTTAVCEQVLIAVGEGSRAALGAYDYLVAHPYRGW